MVAHRIVVDVDKIRELYASGLDLEQIAKRLRVSATTVRARMVEAGIPRRVGHPWYKRDRKWTDECIAEIRSLRAGFFTYPEIAEKVSFRFGLGDVHATECQTAVWRDDKRRREAASVQPRDTSGPDRVSEPLYARGPSSESEPSGQRGPRPPSDRLCSREPRAGRVS